MTHASMLSHHTEPLLTCANSDISFFVEISRSYVCSVSNIFSHFLSLMPCKQHSVISLCLVHFRGGITGNAWLWALSLHAQHPLMCYYVHCRQLLKTELGSFFTEYLQNQLLTKGMVILRDKIRYYEGAHRLLTKKRGGDDV